MLWQQDAIVAELPAIPLLVDATARPDEIALPASTGL
jgi:hypothetical protein